MPNENNPNKDHWKELVKSLDLDVEFDEPPQEEGTHPEAPQPLEAEEEKTPEEIPGDSAPSEESAATSKVDPLFDLGWNTPENEPQKETPSEAIAPEETISEEPPVAPPRKPKRSPKKRRFGFGLFSEKEEEDEDMEELAEEIMEEPVMAEEKPQPIEIAEEPLEVSRLSKPPKEEKSGGASDWMELAAQLGVPIRTDSESEETSSPQTSAEAPTVEEEPDWVEEDDEEYDPLAAWQTPAAPQKPKAEKPSQPQGISRGLTEMEPEEPVLIGKPKEDRTDSKKEPRRGRRRGRRRRDREVEVEAIEVTEEKNLEEAIDVDVDFFEAAEETTEEQSSKHRRRRSRRSHKPDSIMEEAADREISDDEDDADFDDFEDEDNPRKAVSKSHRAVPSWEEAISLVVDKNLGNRNGRSGEPRSSRPRGGRGRSGRRGGRSKE